jgi:hypothetical protein
MSHLDEGEALHFLPVSLEKSDALFQTLCIVHYSSPSIARTAHPPAKRPSLVTVIKLESFSELTATLTKAVIRPLAGNFSQVAEAGIRHEERSTGDQRDFVLVTRNVRKQ